uniref:Uncharacterized protein n=1 Tax=Timema monikensis TaxID=170555 RepID=A0A7R9ECY5_9NEOP|nr:unnamed protein product [Timema monikensis]
MSHSHERRSYQACVQAAEELVQSLHRVMRFLVRVAKPLKSTDTDGGVKDTCSGNRECCSSAVPIHEPPLKNSLETFIIIRSIFLSTSGKGVVLTSVDSLIELHRLVQWRPWDRNSWRYGPMGQINHETHGGMGPWDRQTMRLMEVWGHGTDKP